ncbi:MAG: DNA glycosylase AlkZ-like family protein, partial [Actinomycetota bacterium]
MAERVLSTRELNRALLARQLLLERSGLPLTRAIERIGGLQTQYAPSGYIGLWSRLRDFRRDSLTKALEQRRIVQATLMRVTIHMVSAGDYWQFVEAIRKGRREWWQRVQRHQVEGLDMKKVAGLMRTSLKDGPRPQAELR